MGSLQELRSAWLIVSTGVIGCATSVTALPFYALSSFVRPLEAEFGWSRTQIGLASTLLTLGFAVMAPVVGRLCDRFGYRAVLLPSIACLSLGLASLQFSPGGLWTFYAAILFIAVAGAATNTIIYAGVVAPRFDEARGLALGISLAGTGITAFLVPQLLAHIIPESGWRIGWLYLAAFALLPLPLVSLLVSRARHAHGDRATTIGRAVLANMTLHDAMRNRNFWCITGAFFAISLGISGIVVNVVPMMLDAGVSAAAAGQIAGMIGIGIVLARVSVGYLVDRLFAPYVASGVLIVTGIGCLGFALGDAALGALAGFMVGFNMGAETDLNAYLISRYFGFGSFGAILGTSASIATIGGLLSPLLIGQLYESSGDYGAGLWTTAGLCLLGALSILGCTRYPALSRLAPA